MKPSIPQMALGELQRRLIYAIIVAGKSARFTEGVMRRLHSPEEHPFDQIRRWVGENILGDVLREARTGNYSKVERAFREVAASGIDLRNCTPGQLERIHGIGPKTSRFFILWTRPNERYAALDVHVLRWLKTQGYDVPKTTPTGRRYHALELAFIAEADKRNLTPRELDAQIWEASSGYTEQAPSDPSGNEEQLAALDSPKTESMTHEKAPLETSAVRRDS